MAHQKIILISISCLFIHPMYAESNKTTLKLPSHRFGNGPSHDVRVYERIFRPHDYRDREQLRRIIASIPYAGPMELLGGVVNEFSVALGGTDHLHQGRGFLISNSVDRKLRPRGKPVRVLLDRHAPLQRLKKAGCTYVGKVYIVGQYYHTWDHVYFAALAEVFPWDVDILVIDTDLNTTRPWASPCISPKDKDSDHCCYWLVPILHCKPYGRPVISVEAFRRDSHGASRDRLRSRPQQSLKSKKQQPPIMKSQSKKKSSAKDEVGIVMSRRLYALAGFTKKHHVYNVVLR